MVLAVERQSVRGGALRRIRRQRRGNSFDDLARPGVDHRDRVVVGAGDEQAAILGERHVIGVVADCDASGDMQRVDVDDAYRVTAPVGDVECLAVVAEHQCIRIDLHRNAFQQFAGRTIEDNHVARPGARPAVGGKQQ